MDDPSSLHACDHVVTVDVSVSLPANCRIQPRNSEYGQAPECREWKTYRQCAQELYSLKVNSSSRTCRRLVVIKGWNLFLLLISFLFLVQFCAMPLGLNKS